MTDWKYAWRQIRNRPAFAVVIVFLIGIGIAANATIFTLVDALLLRKLPVRNPDELVRIVDHHPPLPDGSYFEYSYWKFLRAHSTSFSAIVAQADWTTGITVNGETDFVDIGLVSDNYFASLGVNTALNAPDSVVLSHRYWRQKFNADPNLVGRAVVQLNGHPFTIIGVTPPDFHGTTVELNPDVRIAAAAATQMVDLGGPLEEGFFRYELVARLKPGVSLERAQSETVSLHDGWRREYAKEYLAHHPGEKLDPEDLKVNGELRLTAIPYGVSVLREQFSSALTLLMAGVGLVLLMVCSNVAGLLLERATARERETAVRLAVGASQGRLMRQWLTESLLLAALGGVLGVALAWTLMPLLSALIPPLRNRSGELLSIDPHFALNWRVLAFSFAACVLTAVLAGLAPALRAGRLDLSESLRTSRSSSRVEGGITVFQIALCTLLLVEAALFARTLSAMRSKDLGFDRDHIVALTLRKEHMTKDQDFSAAFRTVVLNEVRQLPGVRSAAFARVGLLRGTGIKVTIGIPGQRVSKADFMNSSMNGVSPEYFDTMGIQLVAGRNLTASDGGEVVVVNQALARRFFPGQDPIGKMLGDNARSGTFKHGSRVVGVVSDSQYRSLREPIPATYYWNGLAEASILHIRTTGDPASLIKPVRELVPRLGPGWRVREVNLLRDEAERSIWRERLVAQLAIAFAAVAAVLAAIGLYGTLAYYVSRNRRAIGIRVAIGAAQSDVVALLARRVTRLIAMGAAVGLLAVFALSEVVRALLFGVAPTDPLSIGSAVALLAAIAAVSLLVPAVRASRIDPAIALRED